MPRSGMVIAAIVGGGVLLTLSVRAGTWQEPSSLPATQSAATDQTRLNDLLKLIEGPNLPPAARQTVAREMLRQGWAETPGRIVATLSGQNAPAKVALALALSDLPEFLLPAYVEPLINMLDDADAEVRRAAAAALADYRDGGVTPRLRGILLDQNQPLSRRLATIEALGLMTSREAVGALVAVLEDPNVLITQPALQALEQATAMSFRDDPAAARAWWNQRQDLPLSLWQQEQLERVIQKDREQARRLRELEARLVEILRRDYIQASEADREQLLQSYLADTNAAVRLLGLDLAQRQLGEGRSLSAEAAALVRALLVAVEPPVRVAAVQTVARLREPADAERFLERLAGERHVNVRRALINGLGYIGTGGVVEPLLELLRSEEPTCQTETVAALGRLAERRVLDERQTRAVGDDLLAAFRATEPGQVAQRERLLWAMSQLADPRFGDVFVAALAVGEGTVVRQAAIRGLVALKDTQYADALMPLAREPEAALRRAAVEALADLAAREQHLNVLWAAADPAQEPDDAQRRAAWRGVLRVLRGRPATEVRRWLERLPAGNADRYARTLDLLQIIEAQLANEPAAREELGLLRGQMAAQRAALGQPREAVTAYLAALADLHAARSGEVPRAAIELFRLALTAGCYDETVVSALADINPALDGMALWGAAQAEIERRLTPEAVEQAAAMLAALKSHPLPMFPPEVNGELAALEERAAAIVPSPPAPAPTTQPPATRPSGG